MDDRIDRFEARPTKGNTAPTESQTGHDTDGRSADYDISLEDGREEVRTGAKTPRP